MVELQPEQLWMATDQIRVTAWAWLSCNFATQRPTKEVNQVTAWAWLSCNPIVEVKRFQALDL